MRLSCRQAFTGQCYANPGLRHRPNRTIPGNEWTNHSGMKTKK